ncbi:hypothetical protein Xcel_2110 [Xylanimonas cellulosilytica DSM 15894]|uniref:Uncharacterized protein n=1 Tax=Xylanimonas cellulosilytica (strain DSM 15894 / JCM 12276 / CECT 5975 / KCTC 9989 / LMG 20990 / NBRC 107835 / XIL07) TaxID=446471 RepID=D1BUB5_XYLCX|nr:hypothetical protein [Xylanimonas cellulosilytica]ACZ31128.1 hypothetical protein Xcel_2110 [Xylanimonas cellulosilytica DSM 15894]
MSGLTEPRSEAEWSRRAVINVVSVLTSHASSLTLIGAHAVMLRTADLDAPFAPTSDGDLGVTPGLVGDVPSIENLLTDAGYAHRTTARPGLWGRHPYVDRLGNTGYREKIDLLAPHGLSGTTSRSRRGVPALQPTHGKLAVGNAIGIELAAFNRSPMTITDFADPNTRAQVHVAEIPALIVAKGAKVGERLGEPRKGPIRDKDLGDLWRLMACAEPEPAAALISQYAGHPLIGADVRLATTWTRDVLEDLASTERARRSLEGVVDPAEIDRVFSVWRGSFTV